MSSLYDILELTHGVDDEGVKAAYRRLVKQCHPDVNSGDERAERRIKELNRAYETLSNPEARAVYDLELRRREALARRDFWKGMSAGAAAFVLLVSCVFLALLWWGGATAPPSDTVAAGAPAKDQRVAARPVADGRTMADRGDAAAEAEPIGDDVQRKSALAAAATRGGLSPQSEPAVAAAVDAPEEEPQFSGRPAQADAAPPPRPGPSDWTVHRDVASGFSLQYPASVFPTLKDVSEGGNRLLVSEDGRAVLRIFARANRPVQTVGEYRRSVMAQRYGGASFDYAPQRNGWFVLSGTIGAEMFYERTSFSCDQRTIHGWLLVYPVAERHYYDAIVEEMHRRYRYVAGGANARCGEAPSELARVRKDGPEPPAHTVQF
ncbi:MAG: J domain-containing protein [Hyphomicrobiaceae bacterium]|nr:MAG: J domain-containing protein [Hyphomicrobiaceae bacterium]